MEVLHAPGFIPIVQAGLVGYAGFRARSHGFRGRDGRSPDLRSTRSSSRLPSIRVCRKRLPLLPNRGKGRARSPLRRTKPPNPIARPKPRRRLSVPTGNRWASCTSTKAPPARAVPSSDGSFGRVGQSDRFRVRGQCGALLRRRSGGRGVPSRTDGGRVCRRQPHAAGGSVLL